MDYSTHIYNTTTILFRHYTRTDYANVINIAECVCKTRSLHFQINTCNYYVHSRAKTVQFNLHVLSKLKGTLYRISVGNVSTLFPWIIGSLKGPLSTLFQTPASFSK